MKRIARSFAATVVAWSFCAHNAHSQASDEIVLADEIRTAFYEHAPRALASAMSQAVAAWCSSKARSSGIRCSELALRRRESGLLPQRVH
jgi:hypothetical protein